MRKNDKRRSDKKLEVFEPMVVDDTREALDMAIEALQAEPVVKCKDCRKLNRLKKYTGFGEVLFVCENTKMTVYKTDFCSYGERREP